MISEGNVLANTLDTARMLTRFYLKQASGLDTSRRFTVGDFTTNSIHWIVAHLAWAEDFLVLQGVGNAGLNAPWFQHFRIGSDYPSDADMPTFEEAYETFGTVHRHAMSLLNDLSDTSLDEENHVGIQFGSGKSKRAIINHAIRHEGTHCGHLGWLLRMHGLKII